MGEEMLFDVIFPFFFSIILIVLVFAILASLAFALSLRQSRKAKESGHKKTAVVYIIIAAGVAFFVMFAVAKLLYALFA